MRLWENRNVYIYNIEYNQIDLELWLAIIANIKRALSTIEIAFALVGGCYFFLLLWLSYGKTQKVQNQTYG